MSAFPGWQLADMGCARIVEQGRTHVSTTTYGAPDARPAARDTPACTPKMHFFLFFLNYFEKLYCGRFIFFIIFFNYFFKKNPCPP